MFGNDPITINTLNNATNMGAFVPSGIILGTVRIFFLTAFLLYVIFAIILTRQVDVMSKTVETPLSPKIRVVSYIHLLAAIVILLHLFFFLR